MPRFRIDLPYGPPLLNPVSHGRRAPWRNGTRIGLAPAGHPGRAARGPAEVMVKISGGGTSAKAVAAHFKYIGRGDFQVESDEGESIKGKAEIQSLVADWELDIDAAANAAAYRGRSGRQAAKLVQNVVLSMPSGTPPTTVLEASKAFAREQFALKHRYALVLHTDRPHPHVHLVIRAAGEQGGRLNVRKATLRDWRREFARHLQERGIDARATERVTGRTNETTRLQRLSFERGA